MFESIINQKNNYNENTKNHLLYRQQPTPKNRQLKYPQSKQL